MPIPRYGAAVRLCFYYVTLCLLMLVSQVEAAPGVQVWLTNLEEGVRLEPRPSLPLSETKETSAAVIAVDETRQYQTMLGFGASFTDSSAFLVQERLNAETRKKLLLELFDPDEGIGLSMIRQPLGASDFAVDGNYSYNDMPAGQRDPELEKFSVEHDSAYIMPVLRQALAVNQDILLTGSPWSPPGWMKTSGKMVTGSLRRDAYGPLAQYFVKYIQAYGAQGLPTHYITPNNEPLYEPSGYPGLLMTAGEQRVFIRDYLAPALERADLTTEILVYDHNWDVPSYPETIYSDAKAAPYTLGTAWHCYGGEVRAQSAVHNSFPTKEAYLTECSGGEWQGTAAEAFGATLGLLINSPREWARSVVLWNMALDGANGPTNGGCLTCRGVVTVRQRDGSYSKTVDYYALGHLSKFVERGARRIGSSLTEGVDNVAFINPDGTKVLVAHNTDAEAKRFTVAWGQRAFSYTLPLGAAATFSWQGEQDIPTPDYAKLSERVDIPFDSANDESVLLSYGDDLKGYEHQLWLEGASFSYTLPVGAALSQGPEKALERSSWQASSSSSSEDSPAPLALDGDVQTRWSSGKGQSNGDWFQLDLGRARTFNRLALDAGPSTGDFVRGYQLYTSLDGKRWGYAFASGPATGQRLSVTFPERRARFIRVVATVGSGNWWSVAEAHVYRQQGAPAPSQSEAPVQRKRFTTPTGQMGLALYNPNSDATRVDLPTWVGQRFSYTLPPRAAAIFTGLGENAAPAKGQPPLVTGLGPRPGLAGSSVTLRGRNFGERQGSSAVKFGETIAPIASWSDTAITALLPTDLPSGRVSTTVLVGNRSSRPQALRVLTTADALPRDGWQISASASAEGEPASNVVDADLGTRWSTGALQEPGQTLELEMQRATTFSRLVLDAGPSSGDYPQGYEIALSDDGETWREAVVSGVGDGPVVNVSFPEQTARFVRITQTGSGDFWWSVAELYLFP